MGCDIFNAAGLAYLSYDKAKSLICFLSEKQLLDKFFANNEKAYSSWYCNMGLAHIDIDFEKANQFLNKALELEKNIMVKTQYMLQMYTIILGRIIYLHQNIKMLVFILKKRKGLKMKEAIHIV